jgi:hypothetical protein
MNLWSLKSVVDDKGFDFKPTLSGLRKGMGLTQSHKGHEG